MGISCVRHDQGIAEVVIDVPSATTCTDANSAVYNTPTKPGIVIMPRGSFALKGTYYGLIYMRNEQNSSGAAFANSTAEAQNKAGPSNTR